MPLERVFIDANILVSAGAFRGNEFHLIELALEGRFKLVLSQYVIDEAPRVVEEKFYASAPRLDYVLKNIDFELVPEPSASLIVAAAGIVRDPADAAVLAAIMLAEPDFAITGDKDLLTDKVRQVAPVCRCADYLRSLM